MRFFIMLLLFPGLSAWAQSPATPIAYTAPGTLYTQLFDGLPLSGSFSLTGKGPFNLSNAPINATGMGGWQCMMTAGSSTNAVFNTGTGSSTGNGMYSFGITGNTDRCLGTLASGTGIYAMGVIFTNQTGSLLNTCTISFTAEQWRKGGSGNKNTWVFRYKTGILTQLDSSSLKDEPNLNFSSVINTSAATSLNGNLPENRQSVSYTLTNLLWKPGEQLLLRWEDLDEAGSDDACGIDNFSFTASLVSSAPLTVTDSATLITASTATLNGRVDDKFSTTAIVFEYDTIPVFNSPVQAKALPDTLFPGLGITKTSALIHGLLPGTHYYFRARAVNQNGTRYGSVMDFITPILPANLVTGNPFSVTTQTATVTGNIINTGGSAITERGFVWSLLPSPSLANHIITTGFGAGTFTEKIDGLPEGAKIYLRAYAVNAGGIAYGNEIIFFTQTHISSFLRDSSSITNAQTISYVLTTIQPVTGLSIANFKLAATGIDSAFISNLITAGNTTRILVNSGKGDGRIGLYLDNSNGLLPAINTDSLTRSDVYLIDKTPPKPKSISIPDKPYKIGDTISVTIYTAPDTATFSIITGTLNGVLLENFSRKNDSTYTAKCIIRNNGNDVAAPAHIAAAVRLKDPVGNSSVLFEQNIEQANDAIDAHQPVITKLETPKDGIYTSRDTLYFVFRFSEPVLITPNPAAISFPITIGTRIKQAVYESGNGTDSIRFSYIVQSGESDKDGVRAGTAITINNMEVSDFAGNPAVLNFTSPGILRTVKVDALIPVVTGVTVPVAGVYRTGNFLDFTIQYSRIVLLDSSENKNLSLPFTIGSKTVSANYTSGSGGTSLLFRYKILPDDFDTDGIKLSAALSFTPNSLRDEVGNIALPALNNIGALSNIKINPVTATINSLVVPINDTYRAGDTLDFIAEYNERITVDTSAGIPYIKITIGNTSRQALYKTGSGSNELLFRYIIQTGETDSNGIRINSVITLNNGKIADWQNQPVPLILHNIPGTDEILVDGLAPVISSVSIPTPRWYKKADTLDFIFQFSEPVIATPGTDTPYVEWQIGNRLKKLLYHSAISGDRWLFRYVVNSGDVDKDGITFTGKELFSKTAVTDKAGNSLVPFFQTNSLKNILLDGEDPYLMETVFPKASIYRTGNNLDISLVFSENIYLTTGDSIPEIILKIGDAKRKTKYLSGDGSSKILFRYTILPEDVDKYGIRLSDTLLRFSNVCKDEAGNTLAKNTKIAAGLSGITVNPVSAYISGLTKPINGLYKSGDTLFFLIQYSEPVWIGSNTDKPYLPLTIGSTQRNAFYQNGSGSNQILFTYTVQPGDESTNGIRIGNTVSLNKNTITDSLGFAVPVSFTMAGNADSILVDGKAPSIIRSTLPQNGLYKSGDTLRFIWYFSEIVLLTDTSILPSLPITINGKSKQAMYVSGNGSDSLAFQYTIQDGEYDKDGIRFGQAIKIFSGTLQDKAGNPAILSIPSALTSKGILIDATALLATGVSIPPAGIYRTGNFLDFLVSYNKPVYLNPADSNTFLTLAINDSIRKAVYTSGSGSDKILFRYPIVKEDISKNGISLHATVQSPQTTMRDLAGNIVSPAIPVEGNLSGIHINPILLAVTKVNTPLSHVYKTGDTLDFTVIYNDKVSVLTGSEAPSLKISIGKNIRQAYYRSGSGALSLSFQYIIQPGDEDMDGIEISNTITLNKGFLKDALNNPISNELRNIEKTDGIIIDGISPLIQSLNTPATRTYKAFDSLVFTATFSERVWVSGDLPFLSLTIGPTVRKAICIADTATDQLKFVYIVQKGELGKNGIRLEAVMSNANGIKDKAGNTASAVVKLAGIFPEIKIDAIPPVFAPGIEEQFTICTNSISVSVNPLLTVTATENNEQLTWKTNTIPQLGRLSVVSDTIVSTGQNVSPKNFRYQPFLSYSGDDTLAFVVSDGINIAEKKLVIHILPPLQNNSAGLSQTVCINTIPATLQGSIPSGGNGNYSYTWETAGSKDSTLFTKAPGVSDQLTYTPGKSSADGWYRRKTVSAVCADTSAPVKIHTVNNGLWTGKSNSEWANPGNWCNNLLPDTATDVSILKNHIPYPAITDIAKCRNLFMETGTVLAISGTLETTGNWVIPEESILAENAGLVLSAANPQKLNGLYFQNNRLKNLQLNNPSVTAIEGKLILSGNLIQNKGYLQTNNQLYLPYGADIGPSANGTGIRGLVVTEQLIKGNRRSFRILGNPFRHSLALSVIKDSIDITGENGSANGFTNSASNQPSAFYFDTNLATDSSGVDAGWTPFTQTNGIAPNSWQKYSGIRLLMRGRPGQGLDGTPAGNGLNGTYLPGDVMIKLSGEVNTGDQEITVQKTQLPGYHVIANPYISNINLAQVSREKNIGMHYWLWNPMQGTKGGYTSISSRINYILPALGTFIVRTNDSIQNHLLFTENCKTEAPESVGIPVTNMDEMPFIELRLQTDSLFWDRVLVLASDSARSSFDKQDAEKFMNKDVNFFSLSREQKKLSIDTRPVSNATIIPLGIESNEPRQFSLHIANVKLPGAPLLMLHDAFLNQWIPLEKDSSYYFTTTNDTLSFGNKRFEIRRKPNAADSVYTGSQLSVNIGPVPARDRILLSFRSAESGNTLIRLLHLNGTPVKTMLMGIQKEGLVNIPVGNLPGGVYLLELRCGEQRMTKKIIKE